MEFFIDKKDSGKFSIYRVLDSNGNTEYWSNGVNLRAFVWTDDNINFVPVEFDTEQDAIDAILNHINSMIDASVFKDY